MLRKKKLLQELSSLKCKLELRKERFAQWQKELENKVDAVSIAKGTLYWRKERWLDDRIFALDQKISDLKTNLIVKILKEKMYA